MILLKNDLNFSFQKWDWFIKQQLSILLINNLINLFMSQLQYKPFHTVHGVLKARILKWFAIPFSSGPCFVRPRHYFAEKGLSSQSYGFSSSHVQMWELDHKESWAPKNWCFWTVMLEKTVEIPLDCKEIKPVKPKGNKSWIDIGRTDAEAPILWPPDAKNWLIGKNPDAGKDWRWEEKGMTEDEMVGWHHWLNEHEFEQAPRVGDGQGSLAWCSLGGRKESNTTEQLNWTDSAS